MTSTAKPTKENATTAAPRVLLCWQLVQNIQYRRVDGRNGYIFWMSNTGCGYIYVYAILSLGQQDTLTLLMRGEDSLFCCG